MHRIRWGLTILWLLLIVSLVYDPFTPYLTNPNNTLSPLRVDPESCVLVQGACIQSGAYPLGAPVFWGLVVPCSILILLLFGHELWRRICPLSFLSQIPRALGWQRQRQRQSPSGGGRSEVARVPPDSWLGRHYLLLQFGWLFVGLCSRILFVNSDRLALALWLLFTIIMAIGVGYYYGGKSWCNYFCPMAPVQKIYGEPGGLLTSKAHMSESRITQSMCRVVDEQGQEKSACIACQSPCIDIDSERTYWDGIEQPQQGILYYGYVGLVVGYFLYYYLYAGNWDYYFSGIWAYEPDQWASLLQPGFYLWGHAIALPKLVAVPLTLGCSTLLGIGLGRGVETWARHRWGDHLPPTLIRHRIFSCCTFLIFNFFFVFAARSWIQLLPLSAQYLYEAFLFMISAIWLRQTWGRSPQLYARESLASRLRKQLSRLQLNLNRYLEGQSLDALSPDQVYVLARVLPDFTREKRHEAYKGVLTEALQEGHINSSSSLEVLRNLRTELELSDDEHRRILTELGVEDPDLLDPLRLRTMENNVRLQGFRKSLQRLLVLQKRDSLGELITRDPEAVRHLRQQYCITYEEEEEILWGLDRDTGDWHRGEHLFRQLKDLIQRFHALNQPQLARHGLVLNLLRASVRQKKQLLVRGLLELIEATAEQDLALNLARDLGNLSPAALVEVLNQPLSMWSTRLQPEILQRLTQPTDLQPACSLTISSDEISHHLLALLKDNHPLVQMASLYILAQVDPIAAQKQAEAFLKTPHSAHPLLEETATTLLELANNQLALSHFPTLEKLAYLFNTHFFAGSHSRTLMELSQVAVFKLYQAEEIISDEGDTCRELLVLIAGIVQVEVEHQGAWTQFSLLPGQVLDELEVLAQGTHSGRITAKASPTRLLAIPVDAFDAILERDHDFALRVLKLESARLQQVLAATTSLEPQPAWT
jgi:hypothetical protein